MIPRTICTHPTLPDMVLSTEGPPLISLHISYDFNFEGRGIWTTVKLLLICAQEPLTAMLGLDSKTELVAHILLVTPSSGTLGCTSVDQNLQL